MDTTAVEWPTATRDKLVRAFQPGSRATDEAPFRTLRKHHCVTAGIPLRLRSGGRLRGQLTMFNRLNVEAAHTAREGQYERAARIAAAAEKLENGPIFQRLRDELVVLSADEISAVLAGHTPEGPSTESLRYTLWEAAVATAKAKESVEGTSPMEATLTRQVDQFPGRVVAVRADLVFVQDRLGNQCAVPRWLATGAHRDRVGQSLVVHTERLTDDQAVVEIVPAIDRPYSPFDSDDPRTTMITEEEYDRLSGTPAPLHIPFPVVIHE